MSKRKAAFSSPVDQRLDETIYGEDDPSSSSEVEFEPEPPAAEEPAQKKLKTETGEIPQQSEDKPTKTNEQIEIDKARSKREKLEAFAKQKFNSAGYPFLSLHDDRHKKKDEWLDMILIDDWQHAKAGDIGNAAVTPQQARWRRVARHPKNQLDYYVEKRLNLDVNKMKHLPDIWSTKDSRVQTILEGEEYQYKIENGFEMNQEEHDKWKKCMLYSSADHSEIDDSDSESFEEEPEYQQKSNSPQAKSARKKPGSCVEGKSEIRTKRLRAAGHEINAEVRQEFVRSMQTLAGELAETFWDFTICGEDILALIDNGQSKVGKYTIALIEGTTYNDITQAQKDQGKVGWWSIKGSKKSCRKRGLSTDGTKLERFYRLMRYELTHLNHNNMTFTSGDMISSVIQGVLSHFRKAIDDMRQGEGSSAAESRLPPNEKSTEYTRCGAEIDDKDVGGNLDFNKRNGSKDLSEEGEDCNNDTRSLFFDDEEEEEKAGESDSESVASSEPGDNDDDDENYWPGRDWWLARDYTEEEANELKLRLRRPSPIETTQLSNESPTSETSSGSSQWEWRAWKDPISGVERREPTPKDPRAAHRHQLRRAECYAKLREDEGGSSLAESTQMNADH